MNRKCSFGEVSLSNIPASRVSAAIGHASKYLGAGTFGSVVSTTIIPYGKVAVKQLKGSNFVMFKDEAFIIKKNQHPNIIKLIAVAEDPEKQTFYIVMPVYQASLTSCLQKMSWDERFVAARQAAEGLQFLKCN